MHKILAFIIFKCIKRFIIIIMVKANTSGNEGNFMFNNAKNIYSPFIFCSIFFYNHKIIILDVLFRIQKNVLYLIKY